MCYNTSMAVVMVHNNEDIEQALGRFTRQVIREGIIAEVLTHRWFVSKSEAKRIREHELDRSRSRRRRRARRKPAVQIGSDLWRK